MSYCINPKCSQRENPDNLDTCAGCGSSLLIHDRYRVVKPLRPLNPAYPTDIYEVKDLGGVDDWGTIKVLKVLKVHHPKLVGLFQREARILMFLRHPGIPKVEPDDYFQFSPSTSSKQLYCLVMEKIEGENLSDWLQQNGEVSKEQAIDWLEQLNEILDLIHEYNLFHRDIKPSNIILKPNGRLALIDFGTVKDQETMDKTLTKVGTTGYAAPEQIHGSVNAKSDFFALGRTFVHLLTGIPPKDLIIEEKPDQLKWRERANFLKPWTLRSKALANLIDDMIQIQPALRPTNTRELSQQIVKVKSTPDTLITTSKRNFILILLGIILSPFIFHYMPVFVNSFMFPELNRFFQKLGTDNYLEQDLKQAEFYYKLALRFNPDSGAAHYSLGVICEDLGVNNLKKLDCARSYYQVAIEKSQIKDERKNSINSINFGQNNRSSKNQNKEAKDGNVAASASSNLCRLEILENNISSAIKTCLQGLQYQSDHPRIGATLYKNLGWAKFMQNKLPEAEKYLQQAITLKNESNPESKWAAPYCLFAQVLEAKGSKTEALVQWKYCAEDPIPYSFEEQVWQTQAQQRLNQNKK